MIERVVKLLESLLKLNRATESLLIDVVASYAPWVAPVVPAYMTWQNVGSLLGFPNWAAWAAAICVETLGLSAVQTAVTFWQWNITKNKADASAPLLVAVMTGAFYLAVVLVVNAMLDQAEPVYRLAKALLSSLSVCAGVILALRAGHARRLTDADQAKAERRAERAAFRIEKAAIKAAAQAPFAGHGGNGRKG